VIAEQPEGGEAGVVARLSALPIQSASVDAVLLPHTLEFQPDPQAVVREADRVLTGEGQLIILGFRPLSAWGLQAALTRGGHPPGLRRLLSAHRLRDWLTLLGYDVLPTRRCLSSVLSPFGGVSMIRARKRLYTPTPLRPRITWSLQRKRALIGDAVSPTIRDQA
jgi:SAM-dependent methyltransferase